MSDPDFESAPGTAYFTHGDGVFAWVTDAARSPTHSLKIVSTTGTLSRWLTRTTSIVAIPGKTYTASVWTRTAGLGGTARVALTFWNSSGVYLGVAVESAGTGGTGDWKQLTVTQQAPAGTAFVRVELRQSGTGTSWWDDLSLAAA